VLGIIRANNVFRYVRFPLTRKLMALKLTKILLTKSKNDKMPEISMIASFL